jgi:hypothetical protein
MLLPPGAQQPGELPGGVGLDGSKVKRPRRDQGREMPDMCQAWTAIRLARRTLAPSNAKVSESAQASRSPMPMPTCRCTGAVWPRRITTGQDARAAAYRLTDPSAIPPERAGAPGSQDQHRRAGLTGPKAQGSWLGSHPGDSPLSVRAHPFIISVTLAAGQRVQAESVRRQPGGGPCSFRGHPGLVVIVKPVAGLPR